MWASVQLEDTVYWLEQIQVKQKLVEELDEAVETHPSTVDR